MTRALAWRGMPLVAAALAVLVHARTLGVGFVYDDFPYVVENSDLRGGWDRVPRLFTSSFPSVAPKRALYRPVTALTLFVDARRAPLDARLFHATNLALAALVTLAAWAALRRLVPPAHAGAGALLFAVHPAHVEAIAWVSGRSELLACACACVAFAMALDGARGEGRGRAALAGASLIVGMLAKESAAAAVPLAALAQAAETRFTRAASPRAMRSAWRVFAVLVAAALAALALRTAALGRFAPDPGERAAEGGVTERLPLAISALGEHLRLLVMPWPLSIERMPAPPDSFADPRVFAGGATLVAWSALIALFVRRRDAARATLAAWPLVALLPVAHIVPIGETVAERFLTLPSVGVAGLAGSLLARCADSGRWRRVWAAALCLVVAGGAFGSARRVEAWRDERLLWEQAARRFPDSPTSWAALGDATLRAGDASGAATHYRRALSIDPGLTVARLNAARILESAGDFAGALDESREAVRRDSTHIVALNHFGARLAHAGELAQARAAFERAIELSPQYGAALVNGARASLEAGDRERAGELARRARHADPTLPGLAEIERRLRGP